jgi:hypothetical protein
MIVFSDGVDTSSFLTADKVLTSARRGNIVAYGVSLHGSGRMPFLEDLCRLTGGSVIEIESSRDVSGAFVGILNEFRQRYLVSYSPRGVPGQGWHRLDVRVKGRKVQVKARSGYMVGS